MESSRDTRHALMESGAGREGYQAPSWIEGGGRYLGTDGSFNPNAYDPAANYEIQGGVWRLTSNPAKSLEDPFDLENLRFLDPRKIENLLTKLEGQAAEITDAGSDRQVVAMIGTGGTIAMTMVDGKLEPTLDPNFLLKFAGGLLDQRYAVSAAQYPKPIDSSEQEIDYESDLIIAMSWMWKNMSEQLKKVFAGFLVTHGTDTMGGGSTSVTMGLGPNCPFSVGFVGAQKTTEDEFTDVGANVTGSFTTLSKLRKAGQQERFVYMGGTEGGAFHPAGVIKGDDKRANAFKTPLHERLVDASDFGLAGIVDRFGKSHRTALERGVSGEFRPIVLRGYSPVIDLAPKIGTDPARYYRQIIQDETAVAVMLTTFGSFTANTKIRKAIIAAARERNMLVLGANPFPGGSTKHSYAPAKALRDAGAIPVGTMPDATVAKIFLGSAVFGDNRDMLRQFLGDNNFVGEQDPGAWGTREDNSTPLMPLFGTPSAFHEQALDAAQ